MMVRVAKSQNVLNLIPHFRSHDMNRNFMQSFEDGMIIEIPSDN